MILTPIRRYGAMILMLLTLVFSSEVLAKTHTTTASQNGRERSRTTKKAVNLFQDLLLSLAASVAAGIQFL